VTPARTCAYRVIRRVFEEGAYADRALHGEAGELAPRDRALATTLVYGTVQRRATLDHVIGVFSARPVGKLDPPVLAALRLGAFQLLFLDGVPSHAAVNESVELVKRGGQRGAQLVNAVLRRVAGEGRAIVAALDDTTPAGAALRHSVPEWMAAMWWDELGPDETGALLATINRPAESALRVNTLVTDVDAVQAALPFAAVLDPPDGLVLDGPFDVFGSELFASGALMPQSRGSMSVARALAPVPGDRVLDLCAAPGGKTTHLAALLGGEGSVVAVERHPGRAAALERTCRRMHADCVSVVVGDATGGDAFDGQPFDRVLVDPPCSGLGTLQSRPDIRWHVQPESIRELAAIQTRILRAGAATTAPGGTLVYSVCTISRAEGPDVVERLLAEDPGLRLVSSRQLLPHVDSTDGFFIAVVCRT
jgi:16S rRNA (cytosine967-C5)-methyltransferase